MRISTKGCKRLSSGCNDSRILSTSNDRVMESLQPELSRLHPLVEILRISIHSIRHQSYKMLWLRSSVLMPASDDKYIFGLCMVECVLIDDGRVRACTLLICIMLFLSLGVRQRGQTCSELQKSVIGTAVGDISQVVSS